MRRRRWKYFDVVDDSEPIVVTKVPSPPPIVFDKESPASEDPNAFDFREGDYALIRWTDKGPRICRVWDRYSADEDLERLLPGTRLHTPRDATHPLADLDRRSNV